MESVSFPFPHRQKVFYSYILTLEGRKTVCFQSMEVVQTTRAALRATARNLCSGNQNTKSAGHVVGPRHFLNVFNKGTSRLKLQGTWREGTLLCGKLWAQATLHSEEKQAQSACVCDDWRGDQVTQVKDFPERKWWHTPGIPATQEDEAGGYLRPAWQLSRAQSQNTIKETEVG